MKYAAECALAVFALIILAPHVADAIELYSTDKLSLELSGYLQDQAQHTEGFFGESFDRNQARIRPEFNARIGNKLTAFYSHTLEMNIGSCLETLDYQVLKGLPPATYYDWDWTIEDNDRRHVRSAVYRAYMVYEEEQVRIVAGRQRVAWGSALLWNPTDLFNPVSPTSLEPMEKEGVDGLSTELMLKEFTYLNLVYGLGDKWQDSQFAIRLKTTIKSLDVSIMGGKFQEDEVVGMDFSGYVADGSLYGEGTYTWTETKDDYIRISFGYQYSFSNSATFAGEYYHNGGILTLDQDTYAPFPVDVLSDALATFGRNFLGIMAGYDLTPLVRGDMTLIFDLDEGGLFFGPHVSYLASGAMTIEAGIQAFGGDPEGEYSILHDIFWIRLRYDFA
jgi:hypothetical protein